MKKLLISLCAASLLAASVAGYAGSVTFVNNYNQPVTFVANQGVGYNPVVGGTLGAGESVTVNTEGPFDSHTMFMAFRPGQNFESVRNCGVPQGLMDVVTVVADPFLTPRAFSCHAY